MTDYKTQANDEKTKALLAKAKLEPWINGNGGNGNGNGNGDDEDKRDAKSKIKEGLEKTKDGLPWQAFAIVGDKEDTDTWHLPHHTKAIFRAVKGKIGIERTVDWDRMPAAVAALSPGGHRGQRVQASENDILAAAKHLANHYRKADKPVPDTLAVLI